MPRHSPLFRIFYWLRQPSFIVPVSLITPVVALGGYGIRLSDLIVMALAVHFLVAFNKGLKIPKIVIVFFCLWSLGWLMANLNGIQYGVAFNVADLNFFYRLLFITSALCIGLLSHESVDRVFMGPVAFICFAVILTLCVLYYFGSGSERITLLQPFWPDRQWVAKSKLEWQFPGLGSSRNIFTGSILMAFTFSFYTAFKNNSRYLVPVMLVAITIFCGSRRAIGVMAVVAAIEIFYIAAVNKETKALWFSHGGLRVRRERLPQFLVLILVILGTGAAISQSKMGDRLTGRFVALAALDAAKETGVKRRLINMGGGIARISVAPVLGVPQVKSSDKPFPHILVFSQPHNEWLRIWMFYGLMGVLAYLFLIGALTYYNFRVGLDMRWHMLYFGTMLQMLVDTAFYDFQYLTLIFVCIGINIREILARQVTLAPASAARLAPAHS